MARKRIGSYVCRYAYSLRMIGPGHGTLEQAISWGQVYQAAARVSLQVWRMSDGQPTTVALADI